MARRSTRQISSLILLDGRARSPQERASRPAATASRNLFLKSSQGCRQDLANDAQALRIHFVERVLRRVPIGDRQIDEITAGHAPADKRKMIVAANGIALVDKGVFVAELSRGFPDEIDQPAS